MYLLGSILGYGVASASLFFPLTYLAMRQKERPLSRARLAMLWATCVPLVGSAQLLYKAIAGSNALSEFMTVLMLPILVCAPVIYFGQLQTNATPASPWKWIDWSLVRLNGWQRIGVMLSAVWLVIALGLIYADYEKVRHPRFDYHSKVYGYEKGEMWFWQWPPAAKIELSDDNAFADLRDQLKPALRVHFGLALLWLLAPITFGWLAAYGLIWLIRWVTAGFRRRE